MSREIAISGSTVGSAGIYSSVVVTPPGGSTRVHHHGECETSVYVVSGRARFTWGPTGLEHDLIADPGDFVYIPAGEVHVEANVSLTEPLEVVVTRDCPEPVTIVVD
ncbi:MAG: cupin domain-containing protein [Actinomycetota bacterium]